MNRYQQLKQLGDGTYGSVLLGQNRESGEKVAIKRMKRKYYSWEECMNLREVKSLQKIRHANIVKLKEVIRENDILYMVFEFMKENLYEMMKRRSKLFPEEQVRNITYQMLQGLAYMHKQGFFHRDMKPENVLCNGTDDSILVKIADFGLAREVRSRPPFTDYVSTRWYRAPEVLLRSTSYNSPIDMWALGNIMAEVYTLRPLFPGSSELDQLFKICLILGPPSKDEWPEGNRLAAQMNYRWPQCVKQDLTKVVPNACHEGIELLLGTMRWDPKKRPSAVDALRNSYFDVGRMPTQPSSRLAAPTSSMAPVPPKPNTYEQTANETRATKPMEPKVEPKPVSVEPHRKEEPRRQAPEAKAGPPLPPIAGKPAAAPAGRRRWEVNTTQDADDLDDDLDFLRTTKKTEAPPQLPAIKRGAALAPAPVAAGRRDSDDFHVDDDDFLKSLREKKPTESRGESGRSSASRYLKNSRYLPGINPRQTSGAKDNWNTKGKSVLPSLAKNSDNSGGYVPSLLGASANKGSQWRHPARAPLPQPAPLVNASKQPSGNMPRGVPIHGRTDWAAKYLSNP